MAIQRSRRLCGDAAHAGDVEGADQQEGLLEGSFSWNRCPINFAAYVLARSRFLPANAEAPDAGRLTRGRRRAVLMPEKAPPSAALRMGYSLTLCDTRNAPQMTCIRIGDDRKANLLN